MKESLIQAAHRLTPRKETKISCSLPEEQWNKSVKSKKRTRSIEMTSIKWPRERSINIKWYRSWTRNPMLPYIHRRRNKVNLSDTILEKVKFKGYLMQYIVKVRLKATWNCTLLSSLRIIKRRMVTRYSTNKRLNSYSIIWLRNSWVKRVQSATRIYTLVQAICWKITRLPTSVSWTARFKIKRLTKARCALGLSSSSATSPPIRNS